MKTQLLTFFGVKCIIQFEFIPQVQTVNQAYYVDVLNASTVGSSTMTMLQLTRCFVKRFVAQKSITGTEHTPCSPDLAPNGMCFFLMKSALKGRRFQDTEVIKI
jgi:hypothetical protein